MSAAGGTPTGAGGKAPPSPVQGEKPAGGGGGGGSGGSNPRTESVVLSTRAADRSLWLLKVPNFVAEQWFGHTPPQPLGPERRGFNSLSAAAVKAEPQGVSSSSTEGEVVGKVRMVYDPLQNSNEFTVLLKGNPKGDAGAVGTGLPVLEFPLDFIKEHVPMHAFSDQTATLGTRGSQALALEGKVEYKFDMRPPPARTRGGEEYTRMVRQRTQASNTPKRTTMPLEQGAEGRAGLLPKTTAPGLPKSRPGLFPGAPSGARGGGASGAREKEENKRVRVSRHELEKRLFKLFEEQQSYSLRHLTEATNQPQQFLKEVLNDLCVYHKRGQLQGQYELKPEYKKSGEEQQDEDQTGEEGDIS